MCPDLQEGKAGAPWPDCNRPQYADGVQGPRRRGPAWLVNANLGHQHLVEQRCADIIPALEGRRVELGHAAGVLEVRDGQIDILVVDDAIDPALVLAAGGVVEDDGEIMIADTDVLIGHISVFIDPDLVVALLEILDGIGLRINLVKASGVELADLLQIEQVVTGAAIHDIGAVASIQEIMAVTAIERVIALAAVNPVIAVAAIHAVVAAPAADLVVAVIAIHEVIASAAIQGVITCATTDFVTAAAA